MYMWLAECAIGFSNSNFSDFATYYQRDYGRGVELDAMTYYNAGNVTAYYNYTYVQDKSRYLITGKTITDNNGKVSTVRYVYQ